MKKILPAALVLLCAINLYAQSGQVTDDALFGGDTVLGSDDAFFADDTLFSGDDALFADDTVFAGDDSFFGDDGIDEITEVSAKSDLSRGILFDDGSIKIGGSFDTSLTTATVLYKDGGDDFGTNLKNTILTPTLSADLSVDARPSQVLRMYAKFGVAYPFITSASSYMSAMQLAAITSGMKYTDAATMASMTIPVTTTVTQWFKLNELFTDFSVADTAFFRFGIHTVTWGTGYFFSPVSDMINASSINPEDTSAQVDGCFNLRTQITFPKSQNCLWLYAVPSTKFTSDTTTESYLRDCAVAGKYELVLKGWELGFGGLYKYQGAPKAMFTTTGSFKKMSLFSEFVYQYGSDREWYNDSSWSDKTSLFKATAGFSYYWKTPSITLAGQYYYDSNDFSFESNDDLSYVAVNPLYIKNNLTQGHNAALVLSFGRIFGTTDVNATIFGMVNFGKEEIPDSIKQAASDSGLSAIASYLNAGTFSAMLSYSPVDAIKLSAGPYITFASWDQAPVVSLKLTFTLGGGKF